MFELILSNPDVGVVVLLVHLMSIIRILNGALQFHLNSCETIVEKLNDWLFLFKVIRKNVTQVSRVFGWVHHVPKYQRCVSRLRF